MISPLLLILSNVAMIISVIQVWHSKEPVGWMVAVIAWATVIALLLSGGI